MATEVTISSTDCITQQCTAAILVGGKGRRMGGIPKGLIEIQGEPMIVKIYRVSCALACHVSLIGDDMGVHKRLLMNHTSLQCERLISRDSEIEQWPDLYGHHGPMAGVCSALLHTHTPWVWVFACDLPYLDVQALRPLTQVWQESTPSQIIDVALYRSEGHLHPLAALWHKRALPRVYEALRSGIRLQDICAESNAVILDLSYPHILKNLNSPLDLDESDSNETIRSLKDKLPK